MSISPGPAILASATENYLITEDTKSSWTVVQCRADISALAQKPFAVQTGMSALPPKADMCGATSGISLGQKRTDASQQMHRRSITSSARQFANCDPD